MNAMSAAHEREDAERRLPRAAHSMLNDRGRRWASLLDRIAAGDADALGALYDESSSLMFGLIMHILQDREAAEDTLVDAYVQVREQARVKAPEGDAVFWLMGLARGAALARRKRSSQSRDPIPCPPVPTAPAPSIAPFEPLRRERQHIVSAMDQLTPRQRSIIQMTYFGGLTASEVACELKLSTQQVMSEILRAMVTLRNSLAWVHAD